MITSWRSDLFRILGIFNVCPVIYIWLLLTIHSQAEVAISTNANTSAIRHNVVDIHTIVSDTHNNGVNTQATVSDVHDTVVATQTAVSDTHDGVVNINTLVSEIHHVVLQNQGGADSQHDLVSVAFYLSTVEYLSFPRLQQGW